MDPSEYYRIRLEHTIQHLQQASRLIYFVSGAVIAAFYFVVEKLQDAITQRNISIILLLLLAVVNLIHGLLIIVQSKWYKAIDEKLAQSVGVEPVKRKNAWLGTSGRRDVGALG